MHVQFGSAIVIWQQMLKQVVYTLNIHGNNDVLRPTTNIACLTAIFQDNLGKPVPECLHSGFY